MHAANRLIDIKEVARLTSLSRSTIYRMFGLRSFPQPIAVPGTRRIVWVEGDIVAWIDQQIATARAG